MTKAYFDQQLFDTVNTSLKSLLMISEPLEGEEWYFIDKNRKDEIQVKVKKTYVTVVWLHDGEESSHKPIYLINRCSYVCSLSLSLSSYFTYPMFPLVLFFDLLYDQMDIDNEQIVLLNDMVNEHENIVCD